MVDVTSDFAITSSEPRRQQVADYVRTLRAAFLARLQKRRVYRQILRELQSYPQSTLLDMGIDAFHLERFARRAAGF